MAEAAEVVIDTKDSDDSEDDNLTMRRQDLRVRSPELGMKKLVQTQKISTHRCPAETGIHMTPKLGLLGIGTEVMRQFDERLFVGTVQSFDRKTDLYKAISVFRRRHGRHGYMKTNTYTHTNWPWRMEGTQTTCHRATLPMRNQRTNFPRSKLLIHITIYSSTKSRLFPTERQVQNKSAENSHKGSQGQKAKTHE